MKENFFAEAAEIMEGTPMVQKAVGVSYPPVTRAQIELLKTGADMTLKLIRYDKDGMIAETIIFDAEETEAVRSILGVKP